MNLLHPWSKHPSIHIQWSAPQNSLRNKQPQPESRWMLQASLQDLIRLVTGWREGGGDRQLSATPNAWAPPLSTTATVLGKWHFPRRARTSQITHTLLLLLVLWLGWGMVGCFMSESVCLTVCCLGACVLMSSSGPLQRLWMTRGWN